MTSTVSVSSVVKNYRAVRALRESRSISSRAG